MGARGRKSSAELAIASPDIEVSARPDACYSLRDEEADVWKSIVESLPADWITPGSAPLLAALCRCTVSARRIGQLVIQEETAEGFGPDHYMKLVRAHGELSGRIKALATALRLTPQARYTPKAAGKLDSDGARPWDA